MSSPKYSNNKSQQNYNKGNYLYDHIIPQITLSFGEMNSEQYKEKINKSKWCWKKEVNTNTKSNQLSPVKGKLCATMKPYNDCWPLMKFVTEIHQQTYVKTRLNTWERAS